MELLVQMIGLMALVLIFLALVSAFLGYYSQLLYMRVYEPHIQFGATAAKPVLSSWIIRMLIPLIVFLAGACFWYQQYISAYWFFFICGYVLAIYAYYISRAAMSTIFCWYLKKNPQEISGKTVFQENAVKMLNRCIALQQIIFLSILAFFVPSPFLVGGICSLLAMMLASSLTRQKQPNI